MSFRLQDILTTVISLTTFCLLWHFAYDILPMIFRLRRQRGSDDDNDDDDNNFIAYLT